MAEALGDLKVGVRICPLPPSQKRSYLTVSGQDVILTNPDNPEERHSWTFPLILPKEAMQQQVYGEVAGPLVEDVMTHSNSCILVYGQPKSGKTFTVFGEQGIFQLTMRRLIAEIKGDERGLKASLACVSWKNGLAKDLLRTDAEEYEVKGNMDLFGIPNTTWMPVKNAAEVFAAVKSAVSPFEAWESYEKPNVFVLLTTSRAKNQINPIGGMIIAEMATNNYSDSLSQSLNHTSLLHNSLVILGKVLAELGGEDRDESVLISKAMNGSWNVSLLACISASGLDYTDCFNVLKYANTAQAYPELIRKLKKREQQDTSAEAKRIMQLSRDIIDVRFDLQQMEIVHNKRLKELSTKFGLDFDLNILKETDVGSKESRTVKQLREAVEKLDSYKEIRAGNEHKLQKIANLISETRQIGTQVQLRHARELHAVNEAITNVQELIDQIKPRELPAYLVQETEEISQMLEDQKPLLKKISRSLTELHNVLLQRSEAAETDTDVRKSEREAVEISYKKDYKSKEMRAKEYFREMETSYQKNISDKEKARELLEAKVRLHGLKQHDRVSEHQSECGRLAVLAKGYFDLIERIKRGDFNEGVVPVVIPKSQMPDFPDSIVNKHLHATTGMVHLPKIASKETKVSLPVMRTASAKSTDSEPTANRLLIRLQDTVERINAMTAENMNRRNKIAEMASEIEDLRATRIMYKRLVREQKQANRTARLTIETNKDLLRHVFVTVQSASALSSHESSLSSYQGSSSVLSVRSSLTKKPRVISEVTE